MNGTTTDRQFKFQYFLVYHKQALKKTGLIALGALDAVLFIYAITTFVLGGLRYADVRSIPAALIFPAVPAATLSQQIAPRALQVQGITAIPGLVSKADIVAVISNSNAKWGGTFDYQFLIGDERTPARVGFIFPGETKEVMALGVEGGAAVQSMDISNVKWVRHNSFADYYSERINFVFSDVTLGSPQELAQGKLPLFRVSVRARNLSPFNYSDPSFIIHLKRGEDVVGVQYVTLREIRAESFEMIEATWFEPIAGVTSVEVIPDINILDPAVFRPF